MYFKIISRDITLLTEVRMVKLTVFPIVIYICERWTIEKAESWRINAFKLWCWRRLLRVPWTARRSNQSILKGINPEYSLEELMLKLKYPNTLATWCEEPTHWKRPCCWERLRAGGERDDRGWDGCMASPTRWTWVWANSRRWWRTRKPGVLKSTGSQKVRHDWATKQQQKSERKIKFHGQKIVFIFSRIRGNNEICRPPQIHCILAKKQTRLCKS